MLLKIKYEIVKIMFSKKFPGFDNHFSILDIFKMSNLQKEAINIGLLFFGKRVLLDDGLFFIM
jgi:hypothetical protein